MASINKTIHVMHKVQAHDSKSSVHKYIYSLTIIPEHERFNSSVQYPKYIRLTANNGQFISEVHKPVGNVSFHNI
jgi:hypothetical protein